MKSTIGDIQNDKKMDIIEFSKNIKGGNNDTNYADFDIESFEFNFTTRDQIEFVFKTWNTEFLAISENMKKLEHKRKCIIKLLRRINEDFVSLGKNNKEDNKEDNKKKVPSVEDTKTVSTKKNESLLIDNDEEQEQIESDNQSTILANDKELKNKKLKKKKKN